MKNMSISRKIKPHPSTQKSNKIKARSKPWVFNHSRTPNPSISSEHFLSLSIAIKVYLYQRQLGPKAITRLYTREKTTKQKHTHKQSKESRPFEIGKSGKKCNLGKKQGSKQKTNPRITVQYSVCTVS